MRYKKLKPDLENIAAQYRNLNLLDIIEPNIISYDLVVKEALGYRSIMLATIADKLKIEAAAIDK